MEVRKLGCKCSFCTFVLSMREKSYRRPHTADTAQVRMDLAREIEKATLMAPEEAEEERKWAEDCRQRQMETARRQMEFEQRRKDSSSKFQELNNRWKNLEARRHRRTVEYLQRMTTNIEDVSRNKNDINVQNLPKRENTTI